MPLLHVPLGRGIRLKIRVPEGVHPIDCRAAAETRRLRIRPGEKVLDLGCGCGLFGLAAAKLGAGEVFLTDISPEAVRCAQKNVQLNRLPGTVRCRRGDFFAPCRGERFDLIIANLPQTPGPRPFNLERWGGPDGTRHYERLALEAPVYLRPGGRLVFVLIGIADNARVKELLGKRFQMRCVFRLQRDFTPADYDGLQAGLFDYLDRLRRRGVSEFFRFRNHRGRYWFYHRLFEARLRS